MVWRRLAATLLFLALWPGGMVVAQEASLPVPQRRGVEGTQLERGLPEEPPVITTIETPPRFGEVDLAEGRRVMFGVDGVDPRPYLKLRLTGNNHSARITDPSGPRGPGRIKPLYIAIDDPERQEARTPVAPVVGRMGFDHNNQGDWVCIDGYTAKTEVLVVSKANLGVYVEAIRFGDRIKYFVWSLREVYRAFRCTNPYHTKAVVYDVFWGKMLTRTVTITRERVVRRDVNREVPVPGPTEYVYVQTAPPIQITATAQNLGSQQLPGSTSQIYVGSLEFPFGFLGGGSTHIRISNSNSAASSASSSSSSAAAGGGGTGGSPGGQPPGLPPPGGGQPPGTPPNDPPHGGLDPGAGQPPGFGPRVDGRYSPQVGAASGQRARSAGRRRR